MENRRKAHILISGKVQGVFFRDTTREQFIQLGLLGFVRNLDNGQVEIIVEGHQSKIKKLIEWAKQGPTNAKVSQIKVNWK